MLNDGDTKQITQDTYFYAAAQISGADPVTVSYEFNGETITADLSDNYYYAVGTVLTLENPNNGQGIVETTGGTTYSADWNKVPFTVENENRTFNPGYVVTLGKGLSATIDGETYGAGDSFAINGSQTLNGIVTLDAGVGTTIIKAPANGGVFTTNPSDVWTLSSTQVNASVSLVAATKVTASGSATVTMDSGVPGSTPVSVAVNGDAYVLNGTILVANGATSVTGAGDVTLTNGTGAFTVGKDNITVSDT